MSGFQISVAPNLGRDGNVSRRPHSFCSTDVVDFSGGRDGRAVKLGMGMQKDDNKTTDHNEDGEPVDHFIEIVLANRENTRNVGWFISDNDDAIEEEVDIPFYPHVTEGGACNYIALDQSPFLLPLINLVIIFNLLKATLMKPIGKISLLFVRL